MSAWIPDWMMLHEKLWLTLLAWFGILFLPALFASVWLPDLAERFRRPRAHRSERRPVRRAGLVAALAFEVLTAVVMRPFDRLKARNERILREREARRG